MNYTLQLILLSHLFQLTILGSPPPSNGIPDTQNRAELFSSNNCIYLASINLSDDLINPKRYRYITANSVFLLSEGRNIYQQNYPPIPKSLQLNFPDIPISLLSIDTQRPQHLRYRLIKSGKQIFAAELFGSIGILAGLGTCLLYERISNHALDLGNGLSFAYLGYLTGVGIGVHIAGNDQYESCPWWIPTATSLVAGKIALRLYSKGPRNGIIEIIPVFLPPCSAIISFNIFAKKKIIP